MKMKHFAILPLAAMVLLFGCAKDNTINGGNDYPAGEKTYASFSFNLGTKSKALTDFDPNPQVENATNEAKIGDGDLYILVFNATTKALEYKAAVEGTTHTALLTSGQKKIFVLANLGATNNNVFVHSNLQTIDTGDLSSDGVATTYANLEVGTTTLNDFYTIAFNAGTPQAHGIAKDANGRTFSVIPLYTLVNPGTLGLPMSNHNGYNFTLKPGVTEFDATYGGTTPVLSGEETYNRFKVELDYMGAKARLIADIDAINDKQEGVAVISNPEYTVKNLAKYTSLVQNWIAGTGMSIYHNMDFSSVSDYAAFVDQASTANVVPASAAVAATPYIYVPENTNSNLLRGQSSFYALKVTYKPQYIVTGLYFNNLTDNVEFGGTDYDNLGATANAPSMYGSASAPAGQTYVYAPSAIEGAPAGFYESEYLLAEAVWMSINHKDIYAEKDYPADILDLVAGKYKKYTDAQSWYRIDIGTGSGAATKYGVLRGNAYTATVNNITGPGEPEEKDLFEKPTDPVLARTYINVTIVAKGWTPQTQEIDL